MHIISTILSESIFLIREIGDTECVYLKLSAIVEVNLWRLPNSDVPCDIFIIIIIIINFFRRVFSQYTEAIAHHLFEAKRFSKKYGNKGSTFNYLQADVNLVST